MKIQLDTKLKTIRVEEVVNLGELFDALERLLPNGVWKEFKLEPQQITTWINPIVIEPCRPYVPYSPTPVWPWWQQPIVTYDDLLSGVYNIQMD